MESSYRNYLTEGEKEAICLYLIYLGVRVFRKMKLSNNNVISDDSMDSINPDQRTK